MRLGSKISYLLLPIFILGHSFNAAGQTGNMPAPEDFPQTGVLAASGNISSGSLAIPQLPMGLDGRKVPFVGSLSLGKDRKWDFGIVNKIDFVLQISIEVVQYDSDLKRIASSNAQFRLRPGALGEGHFASVPKSIGCALILKSWSRRK